MHVYARIRAWITSIRHPWRFALYAAGAFVVLLLVTRGNAPRAAAGALLWALLMTVWDLVRPRRDDNG